MLGGQIGVRLALVGSLAIFAATILAQPSIAPADTTTTAVKPSASRTPGSGAPATPAASAPAASGPDYHKLFRPVFQPTVLVWFGGLLWILLAVDYRRFWSLRTLDVLAIVLLSLAFLFRQDDRPVSPARPEISYAFVAWTALFAICAYFFLRTLGLLRRRAASETPRPGIGAAAWVLLAFAVSMDFCTLPVAPVGEAGVRATLGGQYLRTTGAMPYGQTSFEAADGPLMYALHAVLLRPAATDSPEAVSLNLAPTRWISGAAHALLLLGIVVLGWQYHSATTGAVLAGLYGVLAPVAGQLAMAPMTVPAALIVWALIAASPKARTAGAVLSGVLLAAAAGTIFYVGLLAPAWFGYFVRRRSARPRSEEAPSVELASETAAGGEGYAAPQKARDWGALAFVAAFLLVSGSLKLDALRKTAPLPPRPDVCLAPLGQSSVIGTHELSIVDGRWTLSPIVGTTQAATAPPRCPVAPLMQWLADDGGSEPGPALSAELLQRIPDDVWKQNHVAPPPTSRLNSAHDIPLRDIRPASPEAARALRVIYRQATAGYSWWRRNIAAGRTVFESVFAREVDPPADAAPPPGIMTTRPAIPAASEARSAWSEWKRRERNVLDGQDAGMSARTLARAKIADITKARRYVLAGQAALAVLLFLVMLAFKSRCTLFHLCAVSAASILATQLWRIDGGGADVPWYLPLTILALFAGRLGDALPSGKALPRSVPAAYGDTLPRPTDDSAP